MKITLETTDTDLARILECIDFRAEALSAQTAKSPDMFLRAHALTHYAVLTRIATHIRATLAV